MNVQLVRLTVSPDCPEEYLTCEDSYVSWSWSQINLAKCLGCGMWHQHWISDLWGWLCKLLMMIKYLTYESRYSNVSWLLRSEWLVRLPESWPTIYLWDRLSVLIGVMATQVRFLLQFVLEFGQVCPKKRYLNPHLWNTFQTFTNLVLHKPIKEIFSP